MRITGKFGDGGLGYVYANLICLTHNINAVVKFYIDTGSTTTTINQKELSIRVSAACIIQLSSAYD